MCMVHVRDAEHGGQQRKRRQMRCAPEHRIIAIEVSGTGADLRAVVLAKVDAGVRRLETQTATMPGRAFVTGASSAGD